MKTLGPVALFVGLMLFYAWLERDGTRWGGLASGVRGAVLREAGAMVGVREVGGNNRGERIDAILDSVGLRGSGAAYCAAFNRYCYDRAGLAGVGPRSAWSPDWVASPTWADGQGAQPRPADVFGIYFSSAGRIAHSGLVERWGEYSVLTVEGNTRPESAAGALDDREGGGIWRKRRLIRQIAAVRDWIGETEGER